MTSITTNSTSDVPAPVGLMLRVVGAGLLIGTGAIHLDLYLTGYRHIPTIGTLFLLQVIAAFALGLLTLVVSKRVVALAGAGFAVSTLVGYVLSLWIGLFGFNEVRTTAGVVAGILELVAFATLGAYALFVAPAPTASTVRLQVVARRALAPASAAAVLVFVLAVTTTSGVTSGTGGATTANSGSATATTIKISIKNFEFIPAKFSVAPGAKIIVTNHDGVTHTFTAAPGSHPQGRFNSGNIAPGKTVTVTAPTKPGSYAFYCAIHNYMVGTLIVK